MSEAGRHDERMSSTRRGRRLCSVVGERQAVDEIGIVALPAQRFVQRLGAGVRARGAQVEPNGAYKAINATPGVTPGQGLQPPETATTVRVQDGRTLTTDGPFVEMKEALGGYLFFEADDLESGTIYVLRSKSQHPDVAAPGMRDVDREAGHRRHVSRRARGR